MTPDSIESRVGSLEQGFARLEQRVSNNENRLERMSELLERMATLAANMTGLDKAVSGLEHEVKGVEEKFEHRLDQIEALISQEARTRLEIREQERKEAATLNRQRVEDARAERRWKLTLAATIMLGVLAAAVTVGVQVFS